MTHFMIHLSRSQLTNFQNRIGSPLLLGGQYDAAKRHISSWL